MRTTGILVGGLLLIGAAPVAASCRIKNETATTFMVASGNTANQRVGAHATTTIAPGKVQGRSDDGKEIAGVCKDGGDLVIKEKNGVPLLGAAPKAPKKKSAGVRAPGR
ncbi:MAG TPA: hypothetical protein VN853_18395 [Polyangia bacterium]|jgi:hypothetical protein|nr:hypothetical protein [Polyangia bacterium]